MGREKEENRMKDSYGRTINYMRISITDCCNLHCSYCMLENIQYIGMKELLPKEQILAVCRAAVSPGITRFKITDGGTTGTQRLCTDHKRDKISE